jgi:hypothetical protein
VSATSHPLGGPSSILGTSGVGLFHGPFGRLFPNLPPWQPSADASEDDVRRVLVALAESGFGDAQNENRSIPAGYTYFGLMVDHDVTFNSRSSLRRRTVPGELFSFRTPRLDLDCVYGRGRDDQPYLYGTPLRRKTSLIKSKGSPQDKFLIGRNDNCERDLPRNRDDGTDREQHSAFDLALDRQRTALIGDPRNDENIIVAQLHLQFLRFHNRWVEEGKSFEEARRLTRWHYQWLLVHDFLARVCGPSLVEDRLADPANPMLRFFHCGARAFIPVEFSVGAFRFGHSMVRPSYRLSEGLHPAAEGAAFSILADRWDKKQSALDGGRELPPRWTIQWDLFVEHGETEPQPSMAIDTTISAPLRLLPIDESKELRSLPFRTLWRGWQLGLPSGQTVARRMGLKGLEQNSPGGDPLWYYILREAEETQGGRKLGAVGATLVGEVLIGLLLADPESYLSVDPHWRPELEEKGVFQLPHFLRFAEAPMDAEQWAAKVPTRPA